MRASGGDRRGSRIPSVCAALILFAALFCPVSAPDADFYVAENGSSFYAVVDIRDTAGYDFTEPGMLGEKIPVEVSNITLINESGGSVGFKMERHSVSFEKGNYTIGFDQVLGNNDFRVLMDDPYNITLHLPGKYHVNNPLLGMISSGGSADEDGNRTTVSWTRTKYAETRFYDDFQEKILLAFGSFWIVLVLIFLVPYLLSGRRKD